MYRIKIGSKALAGAASKKSLLVLSLVLGMVMGASAFAGGDGSSSNPYEIETCQHLQDIQNDLDANYELITDIDCSDTQNWNGGSGFDPIGEKDSNVFNGSLDGDGYVVTGLYIDRDSANNIGLIAEIGSGGVVQDIGVENINFIGSSDNLGGIVGTNYGSISNSYSTGSVSDAGSDGGGIVGTNDGSISNSYSTVDVSSDGSGSGLGGLAGYNYGSISNSYSTGSVGDSADFVGGFVGYSYGGISNSYWDTESSGQSSSSGGTGLTTSEMQGSSADTNMNFNFGKTWRLGDSGQYPYLCFEKNECNSPPLLNDASWNVSSPEYGEWIKLEANVSDPDSSDYVTEVQLETQRNGTTLFSGNGSIEDGLWVSDSIKISDINVWYNGTVLSATDTNGATSTFSSGNTDSFYLDNPPPQITSAELVDDRRNNDRTLQFALDDIGQNDIDAYSGVSNVRSFTNSSLIAGITGSSLDSNITVSDLAGLASNPFSVDFEISDSGVIQNTSFDTDLSQQRLIQELNITNQASDTELNYTQKFELVNGDNLTDTVVDGVVDPGTSVSNVAGWEGDWITGIFQRSFSKYQSASYDHNEDAQGLVNQTELVADNEQPVEFKDVDISSVCSKTSSTNILPGDSVSATTDCNRPTFEVDYIDTAVGSESQDSSRASDLQTQYLQLQKNISETGGYSWSSVTIFPASIDGSCTDCSNRDRDIGAGQQISEYYHSSGDWISGETEDSYEKYASSGFDHSEEEQKLVNQTRLVVDNQRSIVFSEVNITGQCSNAELVDIASGTDITATTNCSTPTFTVDFINQSISDLLQDESYSHNLSSQGLVREKQLVETGGFNWSSVNISAPEIPGSCENCGQRKLDVEANSTTSTFYNSTGDWIQEQVHNTTYTSGQVVYGGGIEQRFNASQQIYTNNTRSSVGFDVDFTEAVSKGLSNCRLVNDTVQRVSAGYTGNHSFVKSCNPGQEISYTPVVKTDLGGKYEYNLTTKIEVFSELTSEQEHWIGIPQTRLDKWQDRNPSDTKAFVNGQSSEVRVEQGVVNGTEYVFVVVSDEFGSSSLHTGEHTATLIYTEGGDSSTDTGSPGQIGSPIEEVDGEDYSWDLYNVRSQEQEDVGFSIAGVPGREFERRLAVKNTGDQPVTLELECVSRGDACNWVNTSVDRIRLDTQDNTVSYFDVNGRVPMTAETEDVYRFSIRASDPSFDESTPSTSGSTSADFVISISPFIGSVIEGIRNLFSMKQPPEWALPEAEPYPFVALPLISSILTYGLLGLLQRRYSVEVSNYDEIGKFAVAFLVFVIVTGLG